MPNWGDDILADIQKGVPDAALLKKYPQLKDEGTLRTFKKFNYQVNEANLPMEEALELYPEIKPALAPPKPKVPETQQNANFKEIKGSVIPASIDAKFGATKPATESTAVVQPKESVDILETGERNAQAQAVGKKLMYGDQVRRGQEAVAKNMGIPVEEQTGALPMQEFDRQKAEENQAIEIADLAEQKKNAEKSQAIADVMWQTPVGKAYYGMVQHFWEPLVNSGANIAAGLTRIVPGDAADKIADGIMDTFDFRARANENRSDAALYAAPTRLQGNLINDGRVDPVMLLPTLVSGITNMATLLGGGAALGGGKGALFMSSYLNTAESYRKEAEAAGLTGEALENFSTFSSLLTSGLELVSPNNPVLGKFKKALIKEATKDIISGVSVKEAVKRAGKEYFKEAVIKEPLQELLQMGGDKGMKEVSDRLMATPKFKEDYSRFTEEAAETALITFLQTALTMSPGTIRQYKPSNQERSAMYTASQSMNDFYQLVDKGVTDGKIPQEKAQELKDNMGIYSTRVKALEKAGFSPEQVSRIAWDTYKDGKMSQDTKQIMDNPILKETIGQEIKKDREALKNDIQDAAMGIPEVGSEITGVELAEIVKNTPNTGKSLIDKVKDKDYRVTEIDLQEKYDNEPAFKKRVDEYEKSKEDPEGLRTPAIVDQEGKVLDGKKRLVQQYVNGERKARVFQELKPAPVTKPTVIMPEDMRKPDATTIAPMDYTPETKKSGVSITLPKQTPLTEQEEVDNDPVVTAFNQALGLDALAMPKRKEAYGEKAVKTGNAVMEGLYGKSVEADGEMLDLPKPGFVISGVELNEGSQKGKGHGQEVYLAALKKYGRLYSTFPVSEDAFRVHEALERKGLVKISSVDVGDVSFRVIEPTKNALAMPAVQAEENISLQDLDIKPGDSMGTVIDKLIAHGGGQTETLRIINEIPGIRDLKFEVYAKGKNPKIDKYFSDRGYNPNRYAGLYFDHKRGAFPELAGTLWLGPGSQNAYEDLTHELMHFVTIDSIMAGRATSILNSAKYDALREVYEYIKAAKPISQLTNENYGLATFEEFMVESLINPAFRNYVSDVIAKDKAEFQNEGKYKGAYPAERYINEIIEFFKDLIRLLAGGEISAQQIDFSQSMIDNAVRLGTELFFSGANTLQGQTAGPVRALQNADAGMLAMPAQATVKGLTRAIQNASARGKTDDEIRAAVKKAAPDMTDAEVDTLMIEAKAETTVKENTVPASGSVKSNIKAATDTRVTDKVVMNELEAIKSRLKSEMKGFIAGRNKGTADAKAEAKANADHIADIKKQLHTWLNNMLDDATRRGVFTGEVKSKMLASLVKRLNNVKSPVSMLSFLDHMEKTLTNVEHSKNVAIGQNIRSKIKTGLRAKDRNAITKEHLKDFVRINPSSVSDINEYIGIAQRVMTVSQGLKANRDGSVISGEAFEISNLEIQKYIDKQNAFIEQTKRDRIAAMYDNLASLGIIDPATMTAKEMQELIDLIEGTTIDPLVQAAEAWANKQAKMQALRDMLSYQQMALDAHTGTSISNFYTKSEQDIINNLLELDVDKLDAVQLVKLNDVINNIVVNDSFSGSEEISLLNEVFKNIEQLINKIKAAKIKTLGDLNNDFTSAIESFASVNLMPEFIFKYSKLAAEVQRLTGIADVFNGHARAKKMMEDAVTEYIKLKDSLGNRDIDNGVNRYRRGVYADVMNSFGGTPQEIEAEFGRRVDWIKDTADRLSKSTIKSEKKEGEILAKVIQELLDGSTSADDVKKKLMAIEKRNIPLVEFWQKKHADRENAVRENAEHLNNTVWESVQNYTRTKLKGVNGQFGIKEKETEDLFKSAFISKTLTQQIAGSKSQKTRSPKLPPKSVLDLDFDNVQSSSYYHTNFDVETSAGIVKMKYFFNSEESLGIFGNAKNKELVYQAVKRSVEYQRGFTPPVEAIVKRISHVANAVQAKGVRIALGSVEQIPKQYASVAVSTMINLGKDFHLFGRAWMIKNSNPIFKKYGIGLRGETNAGYNKDVALGIIDKVDLSEGVMKSINNMNAIGQKLSDAIMSSLRFSDVSVARTSWLAYYMQDLKRRGRDLDTIDWDTEHENPDNEAAAFAEQMVSRTQTVNDTSAAGNIYKSKSGTEGLIMKTMLPFSGFTVNQRIRFMSDWQKIIFGGGRSEAARSLLATLAEQVLFNWYKVALSAAATTYMARGIASLFGFWDDEDEEAAENKEEVNITVGETEFTVDTKNKKIVANVFSDFFFSGIGNAPQGLLQKGMNWMYKSYATETFKDGKENRYPSLYFEPYDQQGKIDLSAWGSLAIAPEKAWQFYTSSRMLLEGREYYAPGHGGPVGKAKGEMTELTDDEKRLYTMVNLVDMFALVGISEGVVTSINNKVRNIADKKLDERYGSEKVMRVMKPGEGSPDREDEDFTEEEE